jgi:hypothetical protein
MKAKFETYETLSGKFEYLMGKDGFPRYYRTQRQAVDAQIKINTHTKLIKSQSGKAYFIVLDTEQINYLEELENRFSQNEYFMNSLK